MGARDLLGELMAAGLSLTIDGDRLIVTPRDRLTDAMRDGIRAHKPDLLALLVPAPADDSQSPPEPECAHTRRFLRLGLDTARAEALAAWIKARDLDGDDRRVCAECDHFRPRGRVCGHADLIAIQAPRDLGELATTPQRCPGFAQKQE